MNALRKTLFWLHLALGLAAGSVIAVVAFTGAAMSFEPQAVAWADREARSVVPPSASAPRLALSHLIARASEARDGAAPTSVKVSADPREAVAISFRGAAPVFANPYTGEARAAESEGLRAFFRLMQDVHRWLGAPRGEGVQSGEEEGFDLRQFARSIVGASCLIFGFLCLSGLYLWWPRAWTRRVFKRIAKPQLGLQGKAREWNWHNAFGFWSLPVLLVSVWTGLVMAYKPVGDWLSPRAAEAERFEPTAADARPIGADAQLSIAQTNVPNWETITLRLGGPRGRADGASGAAPITVYFTESRDFFPYASRLSIQPFTGEVLQATRLGDLTPRQALRALNLSIHRGEAFGIVGQSLGFLACLGALLLVYTGFAMSFRRFFGKKPRAAKRVVAAIAKSRRELVAR